MTTIYRNNKTVVINFTKTYYHSADELLNSDNFKSILEEYVEQLQTKDIKLFNYFGGFDSVNQLIYLAKLLYVVSADEIKHPFLQNRANMIDFVEGFYNYWRKMERCTLIMTTNKDGLQLSNFIDTDTKYNQLILEVYRHIEENVLGKKNNVYRQLNAGSNASVVVRNYDVLLPENYRKLRSIPFVDRVMLRTPLLLHPQSNKREGVFNEIFANPVDSFDFDDDKWLCYPAKVGSLLIYIYLHIDYIFVGLGLANLFEMAEDSECEKRKPDAIMLFGNPDHKDECSFYHDKNNNLWVGNVSYNKKIEYFGYLKKMALTLHNLIMIEQKYLPLHGSMIEVTLANGDKKGIVFIGDSGAGKSETIDAVQRLSSDEIIDIDVIFDDMGSLFVEDDKVYAQGSETGAFVRLDDLDKASAYKEMDRSIFFNPETSNARVVIPVVSYDTLIKKHPVDFFLYANNYEEKEGLHIFENMTEAKQVFIDGKRFALGTTEESGLSTTFFANPFGPVQKEELCRLLIDETFESMNQNKVVIGEIFTHLGCSDKGPLALQIAAESLIKEIVK